MSNRNPEQDHEGERDRWSPLDLIVAGVGLIGLGLLGFFYLFVVP